MARTRSSYTASPTRTRSPERSPVRQPSRDGSEYEMDLDALGLNSTFESTELQASYEPPVDRVDTSQIEGPEDFTMNMTYWMTADLPLAQIKSRKEAKGKVEEMRMDARQTQDVQDYIEEGGKVVVEDQSKDYAGAQSATASPTRRAHGTTDDHTYSTPASERSMGNDEKVRSFLSALPDTDMEGAIGGTPLHAHKQSFLQIPRSSPPKARSLQPTVEDYDTPRKPTQETVIHHTSAISDRQGQDMLKEQIADLQARLERQELSSKTRITELETILSYTRSELDGLRADNYKQKDKVVRLEEVVESQKSEIGAARTSVERDLLDKEKTLDARMQEFGEEMRLQNLAKLESQRKDFEGRIRNLEEAKRLVDVEVEARGHTLEQMRTELAQLRQTNEQALQNMQKQYHEERGNQSTASPNDATSLASQLSSVQSRADALQAALEQATTEARVVREKADKAENMHHKIDEKYRDSRSRIAVLETNLGATKFELECAQADVAAKQQLFQTNMDLNSQLRRLRSDLQIAQNSSNSAQNTTEIAELETQIKTLQTQLQFAQADLASKDQQMADYIKAQEQSEKQLNMAQGRIEGLESTISTLRQQLGEAHRDSAKARTDLERLERDLEDINDRLHDAHAEADGRIAIVEKKLSASKESKVEVERKLKELMSQHDDLIEGHEAMMESTREKAEDAVRKAGALLEQERAEKRRVIKDLKKTKDELSKLQTEAARRLAEDSSSDEEDDSTSVSSTTAKAKDTEITELRNIIRTQVTEAKTLRATVTTLQKENRSLKLTKESESDLQSIISSLKEQNAALRTSLQDQEAINAAMDEKLASMLSKLMKERARTVVGKRDGQWVESVTKVQDEREILGKVLLRQWGREEVGIADEAKGEAQGYRYKYVKR